MPISMSRTPVEIEQPTVLTRSGARRMDPYKLALFLLTLAVAPLFYVSTWFGVAAVIAIYSLIARLANNDLDRPRRKRISSLLHIRRH